MSNSRKQRFLALASLSCEHAHPMPTKRLPSSPARLLCRSPGPDPSGSSLGCPRPSFLWVMKLTLAHTTALAASHTPVSPTDTAGTHSQFTHAQAQPHQSTALLRMVMDHHLAAVEAPHPLLFSAPLNACRAPPRQHADGKLLRSIWWTCCGHSRPSHEARTRARHRALSSRSWRRV